MTKSINSMLLECFQHAAKELQDSKELEALLVVLGHINDRPGLVTDEEAYNKTVNDIKDKLNNT